MISVEKIDEWIKEAAERPESAGQIIQRIARRLSELSERNEELLAENIGLQSGAKVEEYERRIAHLEYQLELLKRRFGGELPEELDTPSQAALNLLVYDRHGRVLRWVLQAHDASSGKLVASLAGELAYQEEPPRLLAAVSGEELLFIFTSGRVAALALESIPVSELEGLTVWEQASIPSEPKAGERLACITLIGRIALAEFFVQVSRKGCVKKIRASMGQSILANHYIGTGIRQPPDQTFSLALCNQDDRLALVSYEGFLQCVEVKTLPPAVEEALRLESSDHLVTAFVPATGRAVVAMTQVGKAIHWTADRLEVANSFRTRGQALFSKIRREEGARVVGADAVSEADWGAALHSNGQVSLHTAAEILRSGAIPVQDELLAFIFFPLPWMNASG